MPPLNLKYVFIGLLLWFPFSSSSASAILITGATGNINASPSVIFIAPGQLGSSYIIWNTQNTDNAQVWVSHNGSAETLFASGRLGGQTANWIQAGHTYLFRLYEGTSRSQLLSSVTVRGFATTGMISANPGVVSATQTQPGSTTISWQSNATQAQVWMSDNGAAETYFGSGANGSNVANGIQLGRTYTFRLYEGLSRNRLLGSVVVTTTGGSVSGTLSAFPTNPVTGPGWNGFVMLYWSLSGTNQGTIRYQEGQGPEKLVGSVSGSSGSRGFLGLRDGLQYTFRLYTGTTTQNPLATITVSTVSSYGFDDAGLSQARARTEFTAAQIPLLTLDPNTCDYRSELGPFGDGIINPDACSMLTQVPFQAGTEWDQNGGFQSSTFWVLGMNTEFNPWSQCNVGPPNMSEPNEGINFTNGTANGRYGFEMRKDPSEGFWRAHLFVDNRKPAPQANCIGNADLAPWLSIGVHEGFGNSAPVGVLKPSSPGSNTTTRFKAKMWQYDRGSTWADFYVYALTNWGGKNRGVLIRLAYEGSANTGSNNDLNRVWNWPVRESMYFPGNDWAFFDAGELGSTCPNLIQEIPRIRPCDKNSEAPCNEGMDVEYVIDWDGLFQCASDRGLFLEPLPYDESNIPIQGIHWAVENYGTTGTSAGSSLWMSVHDMRMVPSPQ